MENTVGSSDGSVRTSNEKSEGKESKQKNFHQFFS